mgnify:FL=1
MSGAAITHTEMAEEAEREVKMRERVYPNRVRSGAMPPSRARRQLEVMRAIAAYHQEMAQSERLL